MIKNRRSLSINILSALVIVLSIFSFSVTGTNAWFTQTHLNGVEIVVDLANMTFNLYQKIGNTTDVVYSLADNATATEKKYVVLTGEIFPDQNIDLHLILGNDNLGAIGTYVKFKFELYARGVDEDKLISTQIKGFDSQSSTSEGFKFNEATGFYHYSGVDGEDCLLQPNATVNLMTDFMISYESLFEEGNMILTSSDSLYIKLIINASTEGFVSE